MGPIQSLHLAIGELAYAVAMADGKVQDEERRKFHSIIESELGGKGDDFDVSDIIFQVIDKQPFDAETTYNWAMKEIRLNSHYMSPELKSTFIRVMELMAKSYSPVTGEENKLIERFKKDIEPLNGDPVYYSSK
jgi:uncharacterized tellurite resistance protein B-like protein